MRRGYTSVLREDALPAERTDAAHVHDPLLHTRGVKKMTAGQSLHRLALLEVLETDGTLLTLPTLNARSKAHFDL